MMRRALVAAALAVILHAHPAAAGEPHAPSFAHRVYPAATQAARDWAWRKLGTRQWRCLDAIGHFESGWRVRAGNPDGSWGIFQARPGTKYAKYAQPGEDWRRDAMPQVRFGIAYATARYGSPCGAWAFWQTHRWW